MQIKELAEELQKPFLRKYEKQKLHSSFMYNVWCADLADMQLLSKFNKMIRFLSCVIDIYNRYDQFISLKDKKDIVITNVFQIFLDPSGCKSNKIRGDKGSEFYNGSWKSWLENDNIEMHSAHDEGKSVVPERFLRTIKNKIYKYTTSISKNVYIDRLDNTYNNTCSTFRMKS